MFAASAIRTAAVGQGGVRTAGLELVGVRKLYGSVAAVEQVDLTVASGEFLTLLGPSGSGKTTTLRLVAGFTTPTAGTVRIAGRDMTHAPPHRRDVGMVFQNYALFPHMSIAENIAYPLRMRKVPKAEQQRLVAEALGLVQMGHLGDRRPRELSGGQQQRAALARAIVFRPSILLMDEPLGALDKKLREALQLEIRRLHQELRMTVLYVTHDQEEALVLSDRVALFNGGRIVQLDEPTQLYRRPSSVFVADFIGDSNVVRGRLLQDGARVVLDAGAFRVPLSSDAAVGHAEGAEVALVVRLEHVEILPADGDARTFALPARIREVIYLGPYVKYEIEAAGLTFFARRDLSDQARLHAVGDEVQIAWAPDRGLLVAS